MTTYKIAGMDCAEEIAPLRRELETLVGDADRLAFDVLKETLTIELTEAIKDASVRAAVARTGMRAEPWSEERSNDGSARRSQRVVAMAVSGF